MPPAAAFQIATPFASATRALRTEGNALLSLGGALAIAVRDQRNAPKQSRSLHPGGRLGPQPARIAQRLHFGDSAPLIRAKAPMPRAIPPMTVATESITESVTVMIKRKVRALVVVENGGLPVCVPRLHECLRAGVV